MLGFRGLLGDRPGDRRMIEDREQEGSSEVVVEREAQIKKTAFRVR